MTSSTPDTPPAADGDAGEQDFESALAELEQIVGRMEAGDLSLEDALAAFERGVHLTRTCQSALATAEQRVQALVEGPDGPAVEAFDSSDE